MEIVQNVINFTHDSLNSTIFLLAIQNQKHVFESPREWHVYAAMPPRT